VNPASITGSSGADATTNKTRIDVLVLYTPGLEAGYGGADQAQTQIQNLVALANQAYIDSGVEIDLRLVGAVKIDAPDYSSNADTLISLTNDTAPYNNVAWLRDAYGADLVSVIRPFSMKQGGLCGTGWVGAANGSPIVLYREQGFSVVGDGRDGSYYCSAYTFAHELGHNMGNTHDRATVAKQDGNRGAYPYSFGYGIAGQFGTIMSYVDPQVGKFSNPEKMCKGQLPCGISETNLSTAADNALSLNNTRRDVADFTPEAAATNQTFSIAGVVTVQGRALSGVQFKISSPAICGNTGSNGSFSCIAAYEWTGSITPTLPGYTFSPATLSLSNLSDNAVNENFTAVPTSDLGALASMSSKTSGGGGGSIGFEALAFAAMFGGLRSRRHCRESRPNSCDHTTGIAHDDQLKWRNREFLYHDVVTFVREHSECGSMRNQKIRAVSITDHNDLRSSLLSRRLRKNDKNITINLTHHYQHEGVPACLCQEQKAIAISPLFKALPRPSPALAQQGAGGYILYVHNSVGMLKAGGASRPSAAVLADLLRKKACQHRPRLTKSKAEISCQHE
jgi:hypothetical protein